MTKSLFHLAKQELYYKHLLTLPIIMHRASASKSTIWSWIYAIYLH